MKGRSDKLSLAAGLLCLGVYVADVVFGKLTLGTGWQLPIGPIGEFLLVLFSAMGIVTCAVLRERREANEDERSADRSPATAPILTMEGGRDHDKASRTQRETRSRVS